jgi:hypothetical protein
VSKREAEEILVMAFIAEALEEIENEELRQSATEYLGNWIRVSSNV